MPNLDETLAGDTTPPTQVEITPFGNPNGAPLPTRTPVKQLTLAEVLASARRHRTVAHVCTRADLQAEYDELMLEIARLVDVQGRLTDHAEESLGDRGAAYVQAKVARSEEIRREMSDAMWRVEFEGMAEDVWRPWYAKHYPKGSDPDLTEFNNLLIAETAIAPTLTVADVTKLRSVLGAPQMAELANKAWLASATGGVDVPKLPAFLQKLQLQ